MSASNEIARHETLGLPAAQWFATIIAAASQPIGVFTLVILALLIVIVCVLGFAPPPIQSLGMFVALGILGLTLAAFVGVLIYDPQRLYAIPSTPAADRPPHLEPVDSVKPVKPPVDKPNEWEGIWGVDRPTPDMDGWYRDLRPTLHQASFYTVPTYYLDRDLYILDFNVAFEALFREIAGRLRGRHVNWLINKLVNRDQVFEHGIKFTDTVKEEGRFPFVDLEQMVFKAPPPFGDVRFTKVASQLHDSDGHLRGWSVALMIREIGSWDEFEKLIGPKLYNDKLWSVYAGPYDRILPTFDAYQQLIRDTIGAIPRTGLCVGDLGAGTGNVTTALLSDGHRVYAVENNVGMLDRLAAKTRGNGNVAVVKGSVEYLDCFKDGIFDAVVAVNVLYALDDPMRCLREVNRLLKQDGSLAFSTTHRDTNLDALLAAIGAHVKGRSNAVELSADYDLLCRINREIEKTIARRHRREDYRAFLKDAGFEETHSVDSTYHGAVMLVHAKKVKSLQA